MPMVHVVVRPERYDRQAERSADLVPLRWDIEARRFVMDQAIADGYYDYPVETGVVPIRIEMRGNDVHFVVKSSADVVSLMEALANASAYCQESYGRSWG